MVVDAMDERAAAFYRKFDFEELPDSPLHLITTISDIAKSGISIGQDPPN
jgi:hypothetical protein